jgi:PleD family two-component response regulator
MPFETTTRLTILVVDEDRSRATEYGTWLRRAHVVGVARTAEGALDAMAEVEGAVDVVLVGGHTDGFTDEVVVTVRDRGLDTRVVLLADAKPEDPFERGYDDYFVGNVTEAELTAVVERVGDTHPYDRLGVSVSQARVRRNVLEAELSAAARVRDDDYNRTDETLDELERQAAAYRVGAGVGVPNAADGTEFDWGSTASS